MDIIFAGSPSSSAQILSKLVDSSFNISLVLTQGDKRSSRNKGEEPSEVAKYAKSENLTCFKIDSFCDQTINKIRKYPCDILVLSSFGKIIPKEILDHPKITPLNIHFSILPLYRGASPIQSALLNGDIKTGISFMEMVESLDEGPVFDVSKVEISDSDNRISLEHGLKLGSHSMCSGCRMPISPKDKRSKKFEEGVSCANCHDNLTETQKSRFRMRQSQIYKAKQSGKKYIFQKEFK